MAKIRSLQAPFYKDHSDSELLELVKSGNLEAFDAIYHRYWRKLYRIGLSMLDDDDAVSDIVQEVFTALWMKRKGRVQVLNAYLVGALKFQIFNAYKEKKQKQRFEENSLLRETSRITEDALAYDELAARVNKGVAALPVQCQKVFVLHRRDHLTVKEIASKLDLSPKTVENHITNALNRLRFYLKEFLVISGFIFLAAAVH